MKHKLTLCFVLASVVTQVTSQSIDKLYNSEEFVWFGVDYSKAVFEGLDGFTKPDMIKNYYFDEWNRLLIAERGKYDLEEYYGLRVVKNNIEVVARRSATNDEEKMVVESWDDTIELDIDEIINDYNSKSTQSGIGLVYIAERLSKRKELAVYHAVFFDIETHEVLLLKKYEVNPYGIGFRNYWINPVLNVMKIAGYDYRQERIKYLKQLRKERRKNR